MKKDRIIASILIGLFLSACAQSVETEAVSTVKPPTSTSVPTKTPTVVPSDFEISFERGACYGTCPVYALKVTSDGKVVYDGKQFVEVLGEQTATLPDEKVQAIAEVLASANFFALKDRYEVYVTDLPSIATTITMNGQTHSVYHYGMGCGRDPDTAPVSLCELESLLESIPPSYGWVSDS